MLSTPLGAPFPSQGSEFSLLAPRGSSPNGPNPMAVGENRHGSSSPIAKPPRGTPSTRPSPSPHSSRFQRRSGHARHLRASQGRTSGGGGQGKQGTRTVTHLPEQNPEPGRWQHCTMLPAQVCAGSTALKDGTNSPKGPRGVNGVESAKDTELVSGTSRSFPVGEQAETCEHQGKGSP